MVAMDLNGDQVSGLGDGLNVESVPSGQTIFLLLNQSEAVAGELANVKIAEAIRYALDYDCLLYTSPSPRDRQKSRMPSSA